MSKSILEKLGIKRTTDSVQANSTVAMVKTPAVEGLQSYSDSLSNIKESAIRKLNSLRRAFGSRVKEVLPVNDNNSPVNAPEKDFNDEIKAAFSNLNENKGQSARVAQKRKSIDSKFAYVEPTYETTTPDLSQVFTTPVTVQNQVKNTVESEPTVPQTKRSRPNYALEDVNNYVRKLDNEYYDERAARRARGRLTNLGLYLKQGWNTLKSIFRPNDIVEQAKAAVRETEIEANPALRAVNETVQELDNQYYAEIEAGKARGRLKNLKLWGEYFWDKLKWTVAPGYILNKAVEEDEPKAKVIKLSERQGVDYKGLYRQYVRPLAYAAAVAAASIGLEGSKAEATTDTTEGPGPVYQTIPQNKPAPAVKHVTYNPNPTFEKPAPKVNSAPLSPKRIRVNANQQPVVRSTYKENTGNSNSPYVYRSPFTKPGHSECQY